ncbi:hypothetical protein [Xenococcus sp. PCC 7305]|uniref:hypothetical protein n=1 Tax=Xenococcus sp. PCC 7305 TaxID=102125 RepID=UPI000315E139|nr:hypothetical protein [Xenococcus sp. PCC 7305]
MITLLSDRVAPHFARSRHALEIRQNSDRIVFRIILNYETRSSVSDYSRQNSFKLLT